MDNLEINMKRILSIACALLVAVASSFAQDASKAYIIKDGASLWSLKGSAMAWEASLQLGQELSSVSKSTTKGSYKGTNYDLVKIKTDTGTEGYVIDSLVARDVRGLLTVTGPIATLYGQPNDRGLTETIVSRMAVLAYSNVPGKNDYFKVVGYDPVSGASVSDKYLLISDVSVLDRDINVALMLAALKDYKKDALKIKTIQVINQKYPGSAFASTIGEIKSALEPDSLPAEDYTTTLIATDTVNVRDIPSTFGSVVVALKKGDKVTAVKRTTATFTVGEDTGRWVKISAPKEGWVFNAWFAEDVLGS
jgi:hypothetical protein